MKRKVNWKTIGTKELAGLLYHHLKEDGIEVILVGGSCVTIYSNNRYFSSDLDYVSHQDFHKIEESLKKIGFIKNGKIFKHPQCQFLIDFVTQPVSIGDEIITKFEEISTEYGSFKLLTVTDCVKDRLASFYHWDDRQGLNQALDVCMDHKININKIREWSKKQGFEDKFLIFEEELKKSKMPIK
jgi:hypothetical protein